MKLGTWLAYMMSSDAGVEIRSTLDDDIQNKIGKVERRSANDSNAAAKQQVKILILSSENKVRAIACTAMGIETLKRIKTPGAPFDNYEYSVVSERAIPWNKILLIDAGSENTL